MSSQAPVPGSRSENPSGFVEKLRVARLSIISNTILVFGKLFIGIITGSVSVVSEAIHSAIDLLAAIIAYISVRAAGKPPDKEHQFGHGKIETVSGYIEAVLIFFAAVLIIHEAYNKIINKTGIEFIWLGLIVMGISIILNWFVSRRLMAVAKKYNSIALEADALHLTTDIYTSLGVLVGLGIIQLTGWQIVDPIVAIFVAALIIVAAYKLTRKSVSDLVDVKLTDEEETAIKRILGEHTSEFIEYHEMRTRKAGNTRFIDLHLVINKQLPIGDGHKLTDHLESDLNNTFPDAHIMIHIEPCDGNCHGCKKEITCPDGLTKKPSV
ncbi:MAG: cation diffusion facilitator family transporter [Planctomycetota bacterium]